MTEYLVIKTADGEKYLGMKIVSGTTTDIINANIRMKASKAHLVATEIPEKKKGKLYRASRRDIVNNKEKAVNGDFRRLCLKYKLRDVTLTPVTLEHMSEMCKEMLRRRSQLSTLTKRRIMPMFIPGKVFNSHYTCSLMDAHAITCLRTGKLILKNWTPGGSDQSTEGTKNASFSHVKRRITSNMS